MKKKKKELHFWILLGLRLVGICEVLGDEYPCRFSVRNTFEDWLHEDGSLRFPTYITEDSDEEETAEELLDSVTKISDQEEKTNEYGSCLFSPSKRDLTCTKAIDFSYLNNLKNKRIRTFTVDSYDGKSRLKRINIVDGDAIPSSQKLTAELFLNGIKVGIRTVMDLEPTPLNNIISFTGEVFSNKIIKLGWKYRGEVFINNMRTLHVQAEKIGKGVDTSWKLYSTLDFAENFGSAYGNITQKGQSEPLIQFKAFYRIEANKGETTFHGKLIVKDGKISGDFFGEMKQRFNIRITIPRNAFSNMTVNHLVFKNSNFFGDFDSYAFEGINDLQTITFSKCNMKLMPSYDTIFRGSTLKAIYIIDSNAPSNTPKGLPCTVDKLQLLSFKDSGFIELTADYFSWLSCSNLTYLNFHDTNLKLSNNESVMQLVGQKIKYLDVSYSSLKTEKSLCQVLNGVRVTHLSLAGLQLKNVPTNALKLVKDTVEYLSLRMNNFEKIPDENILVQVLNFPDMPALKELDLQRCEINYIDKGAFDSIKNLRRLDLSFNNIINLQDGWNLSVKPRVLLLNMSHNGIATRTNSINMFNTNYSINLENWDEIEILDLSNCGVKMNGYSLHLNKRIRHLSLCNCGLQSLENIFFKETENLQELDLSGNPDLGTIWSIEPFRHIQSLKMLHLSHNGIKNLSHNQVESNKPLMNLEYIDLSKNYVKAVQPEILIQMPSLKTLLLSHNGISHWPDNLLLNNSSLLRIFLDNNKLEQLELNVLSNIHFLREVSLGGNPYVCGCFVLNMRKRLVIADSGYYLCPDYLVDFKNGTDKKEKNNSSLELGNSTIYQRNHSVVDYDQECVKITDLSDNNYHCYSRSTGNDLSFFSDSEVDENLFDCDEALSENLFEQIYLRLGISIFLCVFLGYIWWKWHKFRLFIKIVKNAVIFTSLTDNVKEKTVFQYDAFVSYSDCDRSWVIEKLIPTLENINDIKICLHERDFQVGLSILENIITSIDKSKYIILVLSQAFVKSQWCQYEMHLAYHRLVETRRDQMILILLENIPQRVRPKTLEYLMMTKTYLEWPSNTENCKVVDMFWNRLVKAIFKV